MGHVSMAWVGSSRPLCPESITRTNHHLVSGNCLWCFWPMDPVQSRKCRCAALVTSEDSVPHPATKEAGETCPSPPADNFLGATSRSAISQQWWWLEYINSCPVAWPHLTLDERGGGMRKKCSPWHPGAGLALTATPWCSPDGHDQFHRFPTSDKATLWL